ncbi:hypothetical protein RB195_003563 [Necator americanus]|uniref:ET module n=1 Tax=Necator americanus TaxID=51031 RepID=A0ABR1DRX4_NECAM
MRILLLFGFLTTVYSLKCTDMMIGIANGTSFNFKNTLRCPDTTKWCMSINGSFYSPLYSLDGRLGNCETNGFIGAIVNAAKPIDISCKAVGCTNFPLVNVTRCCCNTDNCNSAFSLSTFFSTVLLLIIYL